MTTLMTASPVGNIHDEEYDQYLHSLAARFDQPDTPYFTTNATGLWNAYLNALPEEERQYHNCNTCRHFIERFGSLVAIDEAGEATSALWFESDAPDHYKPSVRAMARLVNKAKVNGVFLSGDRMLGTPVTGSWTHLAVRNPSQYKHPLLTANQAMAAKREDFKNIMYALGEFHQTVLNQALTLLETDSLYRSEKVLGPIKWLSELQQARTAARGAHSANLVWRAIATAPDGFLHPRASMAGTLLEDISAGVSFEKAAANFKAKMHPLVYQRPQAAPKAGAIAAAEKVMEALGGAQALARRYATVDEVQAIWRPAAPKPIEQSGGVFGHLIPKGHQPSQSMIPPAITMTWVKFRDEVLPQAESIQIQLAAGRQNFCVFTTAVHDDAKPIMQWDSEEKRNPFAWYVWNGGSTPGQFGLQPGSHKVTAVSLQPSMWHGGFEHQGKCVVFMVEHARESRMEGAALFPECLKSELHGIRSTIEAYSRSASIEGAENASACGILLSPKQGMTQVLRVIGAGRTVDYKLDRWD